MSDEKIAYRCTHPITMKYEHSVFGERICDDCHEILPALRPAPKGEGPTAPAPALELVQLLDLYRYAVVQCEELSGRYDSRHREQAARESIITAFQLKEGA